MRKSVFTCALFYAMASFSVHAWAGAGGSAPDATPLTIDTSRGPTDWVINNGFMTIDFNSNTGAIWSIVPTGTSDQLVDFSPGDDLIPGTTTPYDPLDGESALGGTVIPAGWNEPSGIPGLSALTFDVEPKGFYMDLAGSFAGSGAGAYKLTPGYLDFWTAFPATSTNPYTYEQHWVVTPYDPGLHIYFYVNHPATVDGAQNPAASIGQVQWVYRDNVYQFTNMYAKDADLSMVNRVITPLPLVDNCFSADDSRNDQDNHGFDTIDLHPEVGVSNIFNPAGTPGSGIPANFHRHMCVKYDYSSYEYIHPGQGLFGSKYGTWVVFTAGHDTFIGGPQKQNLNFTGGILTIEPLSDHYMTGGIATGTNQPQGSPGSTTTAAGAETTRIFGPYYVRFNYFGMRTDPSIDRGTIRTPDDMYNDALAAAAGFTDFYNHEATLLSRGYVPTTERGSVSVQVRGVAGDPRTAWAVLSEPGTNQLLSTVGYQYVIDISATGSGTFTNVVPGTYRLSVFDFGKWGEYRNDSIVVTAGSKTTVPTFTFVPEDFGTVVGTIGTPDRSSHEFLHGAYTQNFPDGPLGYDDREYFGRWNYWADWENSPVPGAPVYYLNYDNGHAPTNNPLAWNYAHWSVFDPGLYAGDCEASEDEPNVQNVIGYQFTGCTSLGDTIGIPAYVESLPGASGTAGVDTRVPAWQIHFATPEIGNNKYVVLSNALASSQADLNVTLNGQPTLVFAPTSAENSDATERSGLSGYTQWIAFQWPVSALNPVGKDNVISISVGASSTEDDSDDALRLELSPNGANPSVTGWNDYSFVTSGTSISSNDAVPNP